MLIPCKACDGCGHWTPDHSNDPDARVFRCDAGCDETGMIAATPSDLDGLRASYGVNVGWLTWERKNDTLTLEDEDTGLAIVNLMPENVQCLS